MIQRIGGGVVVNGVRDIHEMATFAGTQLVGRTFLRNGATGEAERVEARGRGTCFKRPFREVIMLLVSTGRTECGEEEASGGVEDAMGVEAAEGRWGGGWVDRRRAGDGERDGGEDGGGGACRIAELLLLAVAAPAAAEEERAVKLGQEDEDEAENNGEACCHDEGCPHYDLRTFLHFRSLHCVRLSYSSRACDAVREAKLQKHIFIYTNIINIIRNVRPKYIYIYNNTKKSGIIWILGVNFPCKII